MGKQYDLHILFLEPDDQQAGFHDGGKCCPPFR